MPKTHSKQTKDAAVFKAAREKKATSSESIAKPPTIPHLLKFTLPTILSMVIMSTFGMVDGIFVSRLMGQMELAAVGLVWPAMAFVMAVGFMMGVGGNALVAKKIGEGREKEGRENFSLIVWVSLGAGIVLSAFGFLFPDLIMNILGVDEFMRPMALDYISPMLYFLPVAVVGMIFQQFLITAGKAHYSAVMSLVSGLLSAGLNYVFIYVMGWGLSGAALATSIGMTLPFIVGLIYFTLARKSTLHLVRPRWDWRALGRSAVNGASEMVTMLAASITAVLMNNVLTDLPDGGWMAIGAATVMFSGMGIFSSLSVGYASGVAPIISYNYGKDDRANLRRTFRNSLLLVGVLSAVAIPLGILGVDALIWVYDIPHYSPMYDMARNGFLWLTAGFILIGYNTFASMFFTALNNGVVSSLLSLFRTLIFVVIAFLTLPAAFGLTGAWAATPAAELAAITLTVFALWKMKGRYGYA
jgi:Na+-driven multidrug efflux pump